MKLAQITNPALPISTTTPSATGEVTGLSAYIANIWASIFLFGGIFVLFYLVYGAFRYITSLDDSKATEEARAIITNAIIGIAIMSVSYGVVVLISAIFGIDILNPKFPGIAK